MSHHLPNLEPGLWDTAGADESTSHRSRGVTRATSTAVSPAAGSEKRPVQLLMARIPSLLLQYHTYLTIRILLGRPIMPQNLLQRAAVLQDDHLLAAATVLSFDGASWDGGP